jgi:hypothetical protein
MANNSRVLKSKNHRITQKYKPGKHNGVDLVKYHSECDYITAHSDGVVTEYRNNYTSTDTSGNSYGNYVKIKHDNNYYTLYAHLKYKSVTVKKGDKVKKNDIIGYMGNTGHSYGAHLHFEIMRGNEKIDPTDYLTKDLPIKNSVKTYEMKYKIGDDVVINKVYTSSESLTPLNPKIKNGRITKIIPGAKNPYLLNDGKIGWVNEKCIVDVDITKIAKDVIKGVYGNGATRKNKLGALYSVVQAKVNELLK